MDLVNEDVMFGSLRSMSPPVIIGQIHEVNYSLGRYREDEMVNMAADNGQRAILLLVCL